MNDVDFVEILYSLDNLVEETARLNILEPFILNNVVEQFSLSCKLHDQEKLFRSLDNLIKLDDVAVSDCPQDLYFPRNPFYIGVVLYFTFFQNLNSHLLVSKRVNRQFHFAECSLSDCLP